MKRLNLNQKHPADVKKKKGKKTHKSVPFRQIINISSLNCVCIRMGCVCWCVRMGGMCLCVWLAVCVGG